MERLSKLATLVSQFLNVLIFNGSPDETISGRAYREGVIIGDPVWSKRRRLIDLVFGDDHCLGSHLLDVEFSDFIRASERD